METKMRNSLRRNINNQNNSYIKLLNQYTSLVFIMFLISKADAGQGHFCCKSDV